MFTIITNKSMLENAIDVACRHVDQILSQASQDETNVFFTVNVGALAGDVYQMFRTRALNDAIRMERVLRGDTDEDDEDICWWFVAFHNNNDITFVNVREARKALEDVQTVVSVSQEVWVAAHCVMCLTGCGIADAIVSKYHQALMRSKMQVSDAK